MIAAFITTRLSYAVNGTEFRYYPTNDLNTYKVVTRNIVSPDPIYRSDPFQWRVTESFRRGG